MFLIIAVFSLLIAVQAIDPIYLTDAFTVDESKLAIIVSSILIIVFSLYLLIGNLRTNNAPTYSNRNSEIGEIRISADALENIATKASSRIKGVREQKVRVRIENGDAVSVVAKIAVDGETPIPQLSEEIQLNIKESIEKIAGINVERVHVVVANVGSAANRKARVE